MSEFIIDLMAEGGYVIVFLLMLLETVFPPLPSELIVPFAGFAAARGELNIYLVILSASLGALVGATILYSLAKMVKYETLEAFVGRNSRWLTVTPDDLQRSIAWFNRYSHSTVMFARLVPGIRSLISLPAGVARMAVPSFLIFTAIGTAAWSSFLAVSGYKLGQDYNKIEQYIDPVTTGVLVFVVVAYVYRLIFPKFKMRRTTKLQQEKSPPGLQSSGGTYSDLVPCQPIQTLQPEATTHPDSPEESS